MSDYTQVERVALNKGLNLRDTPETLQEGQWRRLTNVRSFAEGSLSTRPGRQWYGGPFSGEDVHTLVKLGGQIFSGSGTGFYRDTALLESFNGRALAWVKHTSETNDERWLYVTDGAKYRMFNEDGSIIYWGIQAPVAGASFVATTTAGNLSTSDAGAEKYDWRVVYLNTRTGARSNPSPVVDGIEVPWDPTTHVGKVVKVSARISTDGQVDRVEFYRRGGTNGLGEWRLVQTAANQQSPGAPQGVVEILDNMPDEEAGLGRLLELDNYLPFSSVDPVTGDPVYGAAFKFLWGPLDGKWIFAAGDPNRPGHVYWTNPYRPHSASPTNHASVSSTDEPIVGGFVHGGVSYVWTRENLYALDFQGDDALVTFIPRRTFCGRGLSLPNAFAVGPMIWFFSKDGLYVTDGQSPAEPYTEADIRPLFTPQVEDRAYVAPGMLGAIQWPELSLGNDDLIGSKAPETPDASTVADYALAVSSVSPTCALSSSIDITITPYLTSGFVFWADIMLDVQGAPPAGVTWSWPGGNICPGPSAGGSKVLRLSAASGATAGTWTFTVQGRRVNSNGSLGPARVSPAITLTTTGTAAGTTFSVVPSPGSLTVPRESSGKIRVSVVPDPSYTGGDVVLTSSGAPTGVTVSIATPTVVPPAAPVEVSFQVTRNASIGTSDITLTGTSAGGGVATATVPITVEAAGNPSPGDELFSMIRMTYGGQELHVHYRDRLGQWVHLRNHLPYSRWCNDESPECVVNGKKQTVYETISYFDDQEANTTLLIGTSLGKVAVERGTYDYTPEGQIQCRVRDRSDDFGSPRTLKEFGNIIVEADCGDAVLPIAINPSQPKGISMVPFLNSETSALSYQRVAQVTGPSTIAPGRIKHPRALSTSNGGDPVFGYSLGMDFQWNGNATLYGWLIQLHPDEELITEWAFGPTTHGLKGWEHVRDLYLTIRSNGAVTPTVEIDGTTYPIYTQTGATSIPSTGGAKQKVHLWAPALKGKVYRWKLSGTQFRIYGNECEMRVKEFASGLGYQVLNPFQGGMAEV